jgi:hypothetical protein
VLTSAVTVAPRLAIDAVRKLKFAVTVAATLAMDAVSELKFETTVCANDASAEIAAFNDPPLEIRAIGIDEPLDDDGVGERRPRQRDRRAGDPHRVNRLLAAYCATDSTYCSTEKFCGVRPEVMSVFDGALIGVVTAAKSPVQVLVMVSPMFAGKGSRSAMSRKPSLASSASRKARSR